MIDFVNAKINIGLSVVSRRPDGYHDLETVFYPVGKGCGTAMHPEPFGDTLELIVSDDCTTPGLTVTGRHIDCPPERNLVWRAVCAYFENDSNELGRISVFLDKHIPDGAGLGGGSADASFTLRMLNRMYGKYDGDTLSEMARQLGADCPFFLLNEPAFASGTGEKLVPMDLDLGGLYLLLVKPDVYVSTRDAFAGITPSPATFDLRCLPGLPLEEWQGVVRNDFETTVFERHPYLGEVKLQILRGGAVYASMTGSGSVIYGIFSSHSSAEETYMYFSEQSTIQSVNLLSL